MGIRFRKSINLGPLRINISKSGIGYSFGVKGARITKTANGRKRATLSVPGTGLSYVKDFTKETEDKKAEDVAKEDAKALEKIQEDRAKRKEELMKELEAIEKEEEEDLERLEELVKEEKAEEDNHESI